MARALWVRRPGGRCPVAVRGHDRKAVFRRQSALVNAKGALQRLPGPAASKLLSRAAVGNHRPNWPPVPTRPPAAPRAAFKSQRDFVSQPTVGAPAPTLGHHPTNLINPNGVAANAAATQVCQRQRRASAPAQANGLGIVTHKSPSPEGGESNHVPIPRAALRSPPPRHMTLPPLPHRHWRQTNFPCPMQIVAERPRK